MAIIISADEIKKELPNYSPDKAEKFHRESARKADKLFEKALKNYSHREVILLSDGSASGKTEFLSTQLVQKDYIILDATLATLTGAEIKIKKIIKTMNIPVIYAVIPDDLRGAFVAFLNRDRKFSDTHFYTTHSGSRKTLLWIATNYPDIQINIVESSYTPDEKLQFIQIAFDDRQKLVKYITGKQMTEDDIIVYVNT